MCPVLLLFTSPPLSLHWYRSYLSEQHIRSLKKKRDTQHFVKRNIRQSIFETEKLSNYIKGGKKVSPPRFMPVAMSRAEKSCCHTVRNLRPWPRPFVEERKSSLTVGRATAAAHTGAIHLGEGGAAFSPEVRSCTHTHTGS